MTDLYRDPEPGRADVDATRGPLLLEFGAPWCGHCQRAQATIREALAARPDIRHLKIEDGRGRRLGRSFQVKLWPTLVFLRDGREVARVVRPPDTEALRTALRELDGA